MTYGIEFHDSWLKDIRCNRDGTGFALFHACVYQSEGMVFQDAQISGWQNVRFSFEGMRIEGKIVELDQYASDGQLWIDGKNSNGVAMLPANHPGDICLELCLAPEFNTVKIHAASIHSEFEGEFEFEAEWDDKGNVTRVKQGMEAGCQLPSCLQRKSQQDTTVVDGGQSWDSRP